MLSDSNQFQLGFHRISVSSFSLMEDVAKYTRLNPADRIAKLMDFNRRLQTCQRSVQNLEDWGCELDTQMVQLNGRELPMETVLFGNSKK